MLRFDDFKCPEHGRFEVLLSQRLESQPCPQCGAESPRQIAMATCVNPKYLAFRGDVRKRYTRG